jgi:helicase required for RNAi-mediated heterochromatin assembly 1
VSPCTTQPHPPKHSTNHTADAYLSAHYELFREDTVRPLREAICQVRQTPGENEDAFKGTVGIYQDVGETLDKRIFESVTNSRQVFVRGVMCSTRGIALRVTFSTFRAQKKILWEQSKRLISGSLVVLTPAADMFKSKAIVATVAARQLVTLNQDPPEIDIFIARADDLEIDPAMKFIMVEERSAYFEASRHTLLALQKMASEPFPLSEHLVDVRADVSAPAYVEANPSTNMSSVFSGNNGKTYESVNPLAAWPTRAESDVDQFQNAALHSILTKKLSIIQGPPGTGKTFVSVQALKVMLANMKQGDPPIIVTSQTNHALDQLLRHIAKFEENFIRMGGRSKDKDVIKRRTLYEVRKSVSSNTLPGSVGSRSKKKMKQLENDIAAILLPLKTSEKAPLCHRLLEKLGLLTSKQADSLEKGASQWVQATLSNTNKAAQSPIFVWLGRSLEPVKRPGESQDFGFAVEEADLEYEQLMEIEAENMTKEDEEFDGLNGNVYTVSDHFTGRKLPGFALQKVETCLKEQDMWKMPENSRGAVYRHLQEQAKLCLRDSVREKVKAYDVQARLRSIGNWERDEIILRDQKIIAMTTTGFSKYRGLISALQPRVILIEEAAETLEAPVIATCLPSIQQLVLVGDHQQLRPHCNVSAHEGKPYYLNISLFERMILNKVEYKILQKQRRMIPEIRRLLYPIYRDKISDHASVLNSADRPDVPGMGGVNSFFFSHQWPESRDDQMSVVNKDEVDMIVGFVEYLSYNGLEADDITILTFYNGQRKRLLNSLRRSVALENRWFNVVTVDSYQGEENKVVILSLARSNERDQIGFLGVDNRVCVALSRAQCGFYMFGNGMLMYRNSNTWSKVLQIIAGRKNKAERPEIQPNRLAEKLPVRCQNHHKLTEISDASEWENIYGGCTQMCKGRLSCGHNCPLTCHPFGHDTVRCHHQCGITLGCGHTCTALCGEKCACEVCCSRPRALHKKTVSQATGVSSDSSSSWNSFALVEPARCAAIASAPVRDAPSASAPVATNVSIRLVELDDDEHDVSRGVECLTLDKKGQAKGNKKQKTNDESGSISLLD